MELINESTLTFLFCANKNNELRNIDLINKICDLVDENAPNFNLELKNKKSSKNVRKFLKNLIQ